MSPSLNLVFCGTPQFAVPTLEKLTESGSRVNLVVTQPDRPKGRGLELISSPIKLSATKLKLTLTQPDKIKNNQEFRAQLTALKPDAIIVVGYGRLIPQWMLDLPPLGNINLHASLLPKYRGAAPIQWAIASGETITGVTTMRLDAGLDTGDILLQRQLSIAPDDTSETLSPRLAAIGAGLVIETLLALEQGSIQPRPQDSTRATLAPILKKEDGRMDFTRPASEILNRVRAFQPWPGAYTAFRGRNLQVWKAKPAHQSLPAAELHVETDRLLVGCAANTAIEFLEVQPEGKKRMLARDFINGYRVQPGERVGP